MASYKVMLARFPGKHVEHPDTSDWMVDTVLKMRADPRVENLYRWRPKIITPVTAMRNGAVKDALAMGYDYVLMVDNDMSPDLPYLGARPFWETAWEWALAHRDRPGVIAAPYCGPPPVENIYVFLWRGQQSDLPALDCGFTLEQYSREEAFRQCGVQEVAALPTGLCLIDLRVFGRLPVPWFYYEWKDPEQSELASTEDVTFSRDVSMLGHPVWCAWDCWAGHNKIKRVGRPTPITVEEVRQNYREAVLTDRRRGAKRAVVDPGAAFAGVTPEVVVGKKPAFDPMGHGTPKEDLDALEKLVRGNGVKKALEVGSWAGLSAKAILRGLPEDGRLFCVDDWLGNPGDPLAEEALRRGPEAAFNTFWNNLLDDRPRVTPLRGESAEVALKFRQGPLDLIFLDGGHREAEVVQDVLVWREHLRPGGLLVLHDFGVFPGVSNACDALLPGYGRAGRTLAYWRKPDESPALERWRASLPAQAGEEQGKAGQGEGQPEELPNGAVAGGGGAGQ